MVRVTDPSHGILSLLALTRVHTSLEFTSEGWASVLPIRVRVEPVSGKAKKDIGRE